MTLWHLQVKLFSMGKSLSKMFSLKNGVISDGKCQKENTCNLMEMNFIKPMYGKMYTDGL